MANGNHERICEHDSIEHECTTCAPAHEAALARRYTAALDTYLDAARSQYQAMLELFGVVTAEEILELGVRHRDMLGEVITEAERIVELGDETNPRIVAHDAADQAVATTRTHAFVLAGQAQAWLAQTVAHPNLAPVDWHDDPEVRA